MINIGFKFNITYAFENLKWLIVNYLTGFWFSETGMFGTVEAEE